MLFDGRRQDRRASWILLACLGLGGPAVQSASAQTADGWDNSTTSAVAFDFFGDSEVDATTKTGYFSAKRSDASDSIRLVSTTNPFQRAILSPSEESGNEIGALGKITLTQYGDAPVGGPFTGTPQDQQSMGGGFFSGAPTIGTPAGMGAPNPPAIEGAEPADMPAPKFSVPLMGVWGTSTGFGLKTEDGEFSLNFHVLLQDDLRQYNHTANVPNATSPLLVGAAGPNDTFTFPRVWLIFNGNLTKNWEWMVAPSFQFDNVNLLDAWVNAHYDDRFQFKIGRYKTPFTYEFYAEPIQGLIDPERSLFFNNFGLNRQDGAMMHGTVLDRYVDYAIGAYNGQRNGFLSNNNSKDAVGFINIRPFMNSDLFNCALQRLDIGASFDVGDEDNPPNVSGTGGTPNIFRTNVATNGNMVNGVEFMQFKATVFERGTRSLGSVHAAWYYEQLSLIAEYQGGYDTYFNSAVPAAHPRVGVQSWYVQSGYFLTGERVVFRNTVKPLCPFTLRDGGIGAWELSARYNTLGMSNTSTLVDHGPAGANNTWANKVALTDLGVNWYPNQWLKWAVLWEHAQFGNPVTFAAHRSSTYNDMFWMRMQVWF